MQLFEVLQVIIAIIFIYLILSLLASELQEAIASFIEFRARNLRKSIAILLNESDGETPFTDLIYQTQTIELFNQYTNSNKFWRLTKSLNHFSSKQQFSFGPSYINKDTFVEALLQALQNKLGENQKLKSNTKIGTTNNQNADTIIAKLNIAKLNSIRNKSNIEDPIQRLIDIAESVELKTSGATLKEFRAELEKLFDQAQERTSGVYKRNAKGMSFIIGFLLALGLNVDFVYMVNALNKNPQLAGNLTNVANDLLAENNTAFQEFQDCIKEPEVTESECNKKLTTLKNDLKNKLSENDANMEDIILWTENPFSKSNLEQKNKWNGGIKFLGFIISAIAVAMGAPFWFDLLGKFINVRNAGKSIQSK